MTQQKPKFREVYIDVKPRYEALKNLIEGAGVSVAVLQRMLVGNVVERADAEKVLAAFSHFADCTYTLEVVEVTLVDDERAG